MRAYWKQLGITYKVVLAFVVIIVFYMAAVITTLVTNSLIQRELGRTITSFEVERLVMLLNTELKDARRLESEFFLRYPQLGITRARQQYALPATEHIATLTTLSRQLRTQLDEAPEVTANLRDRDIDLNLYLSASERNGEVFFDAIEIVTELVAPDDGLEPQLFQVAYELEARIEDLERLDLHVLYDEMNINMRDYLLTRRRPDFQMTLNSATILSRRIANDDTLTDAHKQELNTHIDAFIEIGEEITRLDVELQSKINDLSIQTEITDPIAEALIAEANSAVLQSRLQIDQTRQIMNLILSGMALVVFLVMVLVGRLISLSITHNVRKLTATAKTLQDGDLSVRTEIDSADELGDLSNAFNDMANQLQSLVNDLETRVLERTRDLHIAAEVSKEVTNELDLNQLLPKLAERTVIGYHLYQVSIYLYDPDDDQLIYTAGAGEITGEPVEDNKRYIKRQNEGLIAQSVRENRVILLNNVQEYPQYQRCLPDTQSELVIPMTFGKHLIGVLDLQSEQLHRFSEEDVNVLTSLSEQFAIAIQNARLYAHQLHITEELRQLDTLKSQFLASMSHELRTPLNAVLNFNQFLLLGIYGELNERQTDAVQKALGSSKHLLSLINDVLDIAKIEAGMMKLFVEEHVDIRKEIDAVIATTESLLSNKPNITLSVNLPDSLPLMMCDRRRVRQILMNLLSNAVKFTDEGFVRLTVTASDDAIEFVVADSGHGIERKYQELIFEPFEQTESGLRHAGSTGLGLPISKRLAESHGGQLWLESDIGQGSQFFVRLPLASDTLRSMIKLPENKA